MCWEWEYDLWIEEAFRKEQREATEKQATEEQATEEQATEEVPRRTPRVMPPLFDEPSPVPRRKLLR
ncbi:MAG: hypothetical protein HYV08_02940 [Deltaproteobacteria bacterium]|nr:hypothetical protein [Deltaproteobacteria bacterium]MBI3075488.1 hypothetical protein [Deltaproteobacteria bacterium]